MTSPAARPRFDLPNLGVGIGLRTPHYGKVVEEHPRVDWFEIISENFMGVGGRPAWIIEEVAAHYPVVMHGVSMSIGSTDPLDRDYLAQLSDLARRTKAHWVSDHLCWTGVAHRNLHDLLPLPYTEDCLRHVVARIRAVQDVLERPLVLENPSSYVEFTSSTMSEWEFLARMAEDADCGLLLDVNNVFVSSFNHGFDPYEYLDGIPMERVVQFHVAGHTHKGTHILDTHTGGAVDEVWKLYAAACERTGGRSTLYEWDEDIPLIEVVLAEAEKARAYTGMGTRAGAKVSARAV
jgi:uncharacterized protein (UPF0276 family)